MIAMKKLFYLLLLMTFTSAGFAQNSQWQDISDILTGDEVAYGLSDISFAGDSLIVVTSSSHGRIFRSTNLGNTWTTHSTQRGCNAVEMLDESTGYAAGEFGLIYKTETGGENWSLKKTIGLPATDISFAPGSSKGYVCSNGGRIYSIENDQYTMLRSGSDDLKAIFATGDNSVWTAGEGAFLKYDGSDWNDDQTYPGGTVNSLFFLSETNGWACGDGGMILHTTDGSTWNTVDNPDTEDRNLNDIFFQDENKGWCVGNGGIILHTVNGGGSWQIESPNLTQADLQTVLFTPDNTGFIAGNGRTLYKQGAIVSVAETAVDPDIEVFPNPFPEQICISLNLISAVNLGIEVIDSYGNKIYQITNGMKPAGEHTFSYEPGNIPPGLYFLRITAGSQVTTKKIIHIR